MIFQHNQDGERSFFRAQEDTQNAGEVSYFQQGEKMLVLDHTRVEDAFQGRHLGQKLVNKVVDYARENGFKIIPQCPFAAHLFEKDARYADVWQKEAG